MEEHQWAFWLGWGVSVFRGPQARLQDKHWLDERMSHILGAPLPALHLVRGLGLSSFCSLGWLGALPTLDMARLSGLSQEAVVRPLDFGF